MEYFAEVSLALPSPFPFQAHSPRIPTGCQRSSSVAVTICLRTAPRNGKFAAALAFHPFWWLAALFIALIAAALVLDGFTGSNRFHQWRPVWRMGEWLALAILVVLGVLRLLGVARPS